MSLRERQPHDTDDMYQRISRVGVSRLVNGIMTGRMSQIYCNTVRDTRKRLLLHGLRRGFPLHARDVVVVVVVGS